MVRMSLAGSAEVGGSVEVAVTSECVGGINPGLAGGVGCPVRSWMGPDCVPMPLLR